MDKVVIEIKFSTQQKQNDIADNAIKKVAAENQRDRQLDIFRIKDDAEFSVRIEIGRASCRERVLIQV